MRGKPRFHALLLVAALACAALALGVSNAGAVSAGSPAAGALHSPLAVSLSSPSAGLPSSPADGPSIATLSSSTHPVTGTWYANDSPAFAWSASAAAGIAGYSYLIDRLPGTVPDETSDGTAAAVSYSGLADGVWYFHVRAEDGLGAWGQTATLAVRIDTTPPVTNDDAPTGWHDHAVKVTLTAGDASSSVASTSWSTDAGADWTQGTVVTVAAPAGHANDGVHAILYRSADNAGNVEAVKTAIVRIDTRPPQFTWRAVRPQVLRGTGPVRLRFVVADLSGSVRAAYRIYDAGGVLVVRGTAKTLAVGPCSLTMPARYADGRSLLPGLYRVTLRLVDAAGNAKVTHATAFRDYRPVQAKVWRDVTGAGRRVALTFDDGYDKAGWAAILAVLHARGAHATFFINGRYVAGYPTLARRTVAWGNAIGSHTWSHILTTTETPAQIRAQIEGDIKAWWQVARATPVPYFRPPYGGYDDKTLAVAGSLGFARVMLWSVDPTDYSDPGAAVIAARVLAGVRSGAVFELHCLPETAAALPAILAGLHARGYTAVTLPALFHAAGKR